MKSLPKQTTFIAVLAFLLPVFAQPTREWVVRYRGPNGIWDCEARDIAVDRRGGICVVGNARRCASQLIVKFDPNGVEEWVAPFSYSGELRAVATSDSGDFYATGWYSNWQGGGCTTTRFTSVGACAWEESYGSGWAEGHAIAVDSAGNAYVAGHSGGIGDCILLKYTPAGDLEWVASYAGPGYGYDANSAIAIDGSGNIYVTGYSTGLGTGRDLTTIKYDPAGNRQWVARYDGPGSGEDEGAAIATDGFGNILVTGSSFDPSSRYDYVTIKYDPAGAQRWVSRYRGPAGLWDQARAIAVDQAGNAYVTGYSTGLGADRDYATVKYDANGVERWVARYQFPGDGWDEASDIALGKDGGIYVTGYSTGPGTGHDYATIRYDSNGRLEWTDRYDGPVGRDDEGAAIAIDHTGNVYVAGASEDSLHERALLIIKYGLGNHPPGIFSLISPLKGDHVSRKPTLVWHRAADPDGDAVTYDIRYGKDSTFASYDIVTGLVDTTWTALGLLDSATYWWRVKAVDSLGFGVWAREKDWCFSTFPVGVGEDPSEELANRGPNARVHLSLVSNPTRGAVEVRYALPAGERGVLEVLDATGRTVETHTLPSSPSAIGLRLTANVPPGVYFLRLTCGTVSASAKVVKLR